MKKFYHCLLRREMVTFFYKYVVAAAGSGWSVSMGMYRYIYPKKRCRKKIKKGKIDANRRDTSQDYTINRIAIRHNNPF